MSQSDRKRSREKNRGWLGGPKVWVRQTTPKPSRTKREREREGQRNSKRERERQRVAILAQVDLPLPSGGRSRTAWWGCCWEQQTCRVDDPSSGGRLERTPAAFAVKWPIFIGLWASTVPRRHTFWPASSNFYATSSRGSLKVSLGSSDLFVNRCRPDPSGRWQRRLLRLSDPAQGEPVRIDPGGAVPRTGRLGTSRSWQWQGAREADLHTTTGGPASKHAHERGRRPLIPSCSRETWKVSGGYVTSEPAPGSSTNQGATLSSPAVSSTSTTLRSGNPTRSDDRTRRTELRRVNKSERGAEGQPF